MVSGRALKMYSWTAYKIFSGQKECLSKPPQTPLPMGLRLLLRCTVKHIPPVSEEDLCKLNNSSMFNTNTPVGLQNKVWFEVTCHGGQETCVSLIDSYFAFSADAIQADVLCTSTEAN